MTTTFDTTTYSTGRGINGALSAHVCNVETFEAQLPNAYSLKEGYLYAVPANILTSGLVRESLAVYGTGLITNMTSFNTAMTTPMTGAITLPSSSAQHIFVISIGTLIAPFSATILYQRIGGTVYGFYIVGFPPAFGTNSASFIPAMREPAIGMDIAFLQDSAAVFTYTSNFKFTLRAMYRNAYLVTNNGSLTCALHDGTTLFANKCTITNLAGKITFSAFQLNNVALVSQDIPSHGSLIFSLATPFSIPSIAIPGYIPGNNGQLCDVSSTKYNARYLAIVTLIDYEN